MVGETQQTISAIVERRPLPSFEQWLTDHGNGKRGDGFEAFDDLVRRSHETGFDVPGLDPQSLSFLRMWLGLQIAVTELCNIEHQHGRKPLDIIRVMPRVLAAAAMYSTSSVLSDEAPLRQVAKTLIEEFRFAAKAAADQIEAAR